MPKMAKRGFLRGGSEPAYADITPFDFIRSTILNVVEGLTAILHIAAWALAELRERLKMYEDREQEERENLKPLTMDELMEINEEPVWIKLFGTDEEFGF